MFCHAEDGHYAPLQMENGKWVIRDVPQPQAARDGCFAQSVLFLNAFDKCADVGRAKELAADPSRVQEFYKSMGQYARTSQEVRQECCDGM